MGEIEYLIRNSLLGNVPEFTEGAVSEFTGLTYVDLLPCCIAEESIFAVTADYDELVVYDHLGRVVDDEDLADMVVRWGLRKMLKLNDGIVAIGFLDNSPVHKFINVDGYQRFAGLANASQGVGWLGSSFAPAYFQWVLGTEYIPRSLVYRGGLPFNGRSGDPVNWFRERYPGYRVIIRAGDEPIHLENRRVYVVDCS